MRFFNLGAWVYRITLVVLAVFGATTVSGKMAFACGPVEGGFSQGAGIASGIGIFVGCPLAAVGLAEGVDRLTGYKPGPVTKFVTGLTCAVISAGILQTLSEQSARKALERGATEVAKAGLKNVGKTGLVAGAALVGAPALLVAATLSTVGVLASPDVMAADEEFSARLNPQVVQGERVKPQWEIDSSVKEESSAAAAQSALRPQ